MTGTRPEHPIQGESNSERPNWGSVDVLNDDELDRKLYQEPPSPSAKPRARPGAAQIR